MSDEAPFADVVEPKRRWPAKLLAFAALVALLAVWKAWDLYAPLTISRETTYITEPLAFDGAPDYERYALDQLSEGITPDENAAVLLWQAIGSDDLVAANKQEVAAALGLPRPPLDDPRLAPLYGESTRQRLRDWLIEVKGDGPQPTDRDADEVIYRAEDCPWSASQCPPLFRWLDENEAAIDLIADATNRPRLFFPPPAFLNDSYDSLLTVYWPQADMCCKAAEALSIRCMNHVAENRLEAAWRDAWATYRLSLLLGGSWSAIERIQATKIQSVACHEIYAVLSSHRLRPALARRMLKALQAAKRLDLMREAIYESERLMYVDALVGDAAGRVSTGKWTEQAPDRRLDYNILLRSLNQSMDELFAAYRQPERAARDRAFQQACHALQKRHDSKSSPTLRASAMISKMAYSRLICDTIIPLMIPTLGIISHAQDRADAEFDLLLVAAALAVHRAEHGEYPESLDALAPDILPSVPADLYSGQPLIYHRKPDGYLLYSVFNNGVDDGGDDWGGEIIDGEWFDPNAEPDDADEDAELEWQREPINLDNSDSVIRIPVPAFVAPIPPVDED